MLLWPGKKARQARAWNLEWGTQCGVKWVNFGSREFRVERGFFICGRGSREGDTGDVDCVTKSFVISASDNLRHLYVCLTSVTSSRVDLPFYLKNPETPPFQKKDPNKPNSFPNLSILPPFVFH